MHMHTHTHTHTHTHIHTHTHLQMIGLAWMVFKNHMDGPYLFAYIIAPIVGASLGAAAWSYIDRAIGKIK